ncbi:MAG: GNAT family N-acetyltransferase [Gaiellaceae bacterium]
MGTGRVRIRARGPDDVDRRLIGELARLHGEALDAGMALGATVDTDLEDLHRTALADGDRVLVVAERADEVVGMAQLVPSTAANARHRAEVQRVAVAADARGTGVGRELMQVLEDVARARGLTLLWLTTHEGSDACAFYEAVGYTKLGVMPEYSERPNGELADGAFYCKVLRGSS